jgi:hypothetical protein
MYRFYGKTIKNDGYARWVGHSRHSVLFGCIWVSQGLEVSKGITREQSPIKPHSDCHLVQLSLKGTSTGHCAPRAALAPQIQVAAQGWLLSMLPGAIDCPTTFSLQHMDGTASHQSSILNTVQAAIISVTSACLLGIYGI